MYEILPRNRAKLVQTHAQHGWSIAKRGLCSRPAANSRPIFQHSSHVFRRHRQSAWWRLQKYVVIAANQPGLAWQFIGRMNTCCQKTKQFLFLLRWKRFRSRLYLGKSSHTTEPIAHLAF